MSVIVLNAVLLGFSTYSAFANLSSLKWLEKAVLYIFAIEMALKVIAFRREFFKNKANSFDFIVVLLCFLPEVANVSVLRLLRIFSLLRLFSAVPQFRFIVAVIFKTAPNAFYIGLVLLLIIYVYAVLCVNFFGREFPELFGSLGDAFFTLFQLATMEDWTNGIALPLMRVYPYSWIVIISFILIVSFVLLNMVVGIIVDSINEVREQKSQKNSENSRENSQRKDKK